MMRKLINTFALLALLCAPLASRVAAQAPGTVRVIDTLTDTGGNPLTGKVTFILTQKSVTGPAGLVAVRATVSAVLTSTGRFDVRLYPSHSLSPASYYQVWHVDPSGTQEFLGVYDIPASATPIPLTGHKVTDTALAAQYTFASVVDVQAVIAAAAAATTAQLYPSLAASHIVYWDGVSFANSPVRVTGSSVTVDGGVSAGAVTAGTVTAGSYVGIQPAAIPGLSATKIISETLDPARIPTTLNNITCVNCTSIGTASGGGSVTSADNVLGSTGGRVTLQTAGVERLGVDNDGTVRVPRLVASPTLPLQFMSNPALWAQERVETPIADFTGVAGEDREMYSPSGQRVPSGDVIVATKGANRVHFWKLPGGSPPRAYLGVGITCTSGWCGDGVVNPTLVYNSVTGHMDAFFTGYSGSTYQVGHADCSGTNFLTCVKDPLPILTPSQVSTALEGGAAVFGLTLSDVIKLPASDGGGYRFYGYYWLTGTGESKIFVATGTTLTNPTPTAVIMRSLSAKRVVERFVAFKQPGSTLWTGVYSEGGPQNVAGLTQHMNLRVATSTDGINWTVPRQGNVLMEALYATPTLGLNYAREAVFAASIVKKSDASPEPELINGRVYLLYSGLYAHEAKSALAYLDPGVGRTPPFSVSAESDNASKISFENSVGELASGHISTYDDNLGVDVWLSSNMRVGPGPTLLIDDTSQAASAVIASRQGQIVFRQFPAGGTDTSFDVTRTGFFDLDGSLILDKGNFQLLGAGKGIKLKSPSGTVYTVTVSDAGALVIF